MKRRALNKNEDGLVSIVVVSVIIVILSLMTIGFARIMDRELRQALDRELASQANYAAESAMNDAQGYIKDLTDNGLDPSTLRKCLDLNSTSSASPFVSKGSISGNYSGDTNDNVVKYSCVIIDTKARELKYDIPAGQSRIFKITTPNINKLYFSWENQQYPVVGGIQQVSAFPVAANQLPQESQMTSSSTGMLRASIYPVPNSTAASRSPDVQNANLGNVSRSFFFYPNSSSSPGQVTDVSYNNNGAFVNGNCNTANRTNTSYLPFTNSTGRYCNGAIDSMPGGQAFYYLRLTSLYKDVSISIQGSDAANGSIELAGAQATIDITAKGNDVLKRLQGRMPLNFDYDYPFAAVDSMNTICKKFRLPKIGPGSSSADYDPAYIDDAQGAGTDCQPQATGVVNPPPGPPPPPGSSCTPVKPNDIVFTIDTSQSMTSYNYANSGQSKLNVLKAATTGLVNRLGVSAGGNHVGVVAFDDTGKQLIQLSYNVPAINSAINNPPPYLYGGTQIRLGLQNARSELNNTTYARPVAQASHVVILVTDGLPDDSFASILAAANQLKREGAVIYAIEVGGGSTLQSRALLTAIAAPTGTFFRAPTPADLTAILDALKYNLC